MKTAISIPDDLLKEIENIAKKNNFSRSKIFFVAILF